MGASGSGKSTLARILMGLESYDEGEIYYKSAPFREMPLRELRRENAILFQDLRFAMNPSFTVREIILEPVMINEAPGRGEAEARLRLLAELTEVEPGLFNRRPDELSGGELRRVQLARVLSLRPEYVILDEPFSALDELTASRLMVKFRELFTRLGMGALYICHQSHHAGYFADIATDFSSCLGS